MSDEQQDINFDTKGVITLITAFSIIFSFIPPLVYRILQKDLIEEHYKKYLTNLLNFEITIFTIELICSFVFSPLTGIIFMINMVFLMIAAAKIYNNQFYRFPFAIEVIK